MNMFETVDCPYCEHENEITFDDHEGAETFDYICCKCEKEFEVNVEYDPIYSGSEIEYKKCSECGEEYRYEGRIYPQPKKYKNVDRDDYNICRECYFTMIKEDLKIESKVKQD